MEVPTPLDRCLATAVLLFRVMKGVIKKRDLYSSPVDEIHLKGMTDNEVFRPTAYVAG